MTNTGMYTSADRVERGGFLVAYAGETMDMREAVRRGLVPDAADDAAPSSADGGQTEDAPSSADGGQAEDAPSSADGGQAEDAPSSADGDAPDAPEGKQVRKRRAPRKAN